MELEEAVKQSVSYREVCKHLGKNIIGGEYRKVRNEIISRGLDISHFNPFARTNSWWDSKKKILEEILVENSSYPTSHLRNRLIKEGVKENKCETCGLGPEWNGKSLTLQLDHINGISTDHRLDNLRILCPNCHTQTPTYCGKNVKR